MLSKTILTTLLAATASARTLTPRQTVSQSIQLENFAIDASTEGEQVTYSLSVQRGTETALCQIFINAGNQNDGCYDTPDIFGFELEPCTNENFSWAITKYEGGFELTLNAIVDEEPEKPNLTACYNIPDSAFECTDGEMRVFGPTNANVVGTVDTKCSF